jgi:hypothetical protein
MSRGARSREGGAGRRVFLGPIIKRPITTYVGFYHRGHAFGLYCSRFLLTLIRSCSRRFKIVAIKRPWAYHIKITTVTLIMLERNHFNIRITPVL